MSIKVKCFATVVDRLVSIHSGSFDMTSAECARVLIDSSFEKGRLGLFINVIAGNDSESKEVPLELALLNDYSFLNYMSFPLPILNPLVKRGLHQGGEFHPSRIWIYGKYFYVVNRNYQQDEELTVGSLIKVHADKRERRLKEVVHLAGLASY